MTATVPLFLIIVAGGSGARFGGCKLLCDLAGKPVIIHSLEHLSAVAQRTILVVPQRERDNFAAALQRFDYLERVEIVSGGACRTASVANGLQALANEKNGIVAIHDGARPLARTQLLTDLVALAQTYGGAVPAHPVADSLKYADADQMVTSAPSRERLFAVATPQVFQLDLFRQALASCHNQQFTDDAELFRAAGNQVKLLVTTEPNWKLTWRSDLELLKLFI